MQRYTVYLFLETALHTTVSTISGAGQTITATCSCRGRDGTDKVVCAPDDGRRYHSEHVEQFPDVNELCNVVSFWIYIGIYLRCTDS
jgi:hypothetical protein